MTRTPLQAERELSCSGKVDSDCCIRRITHGQNALVLHERAKKDIIVTWLNENILNHL
jgi:hypothetical protein